MWKLLGFSAAVLLSGCSENEKIAGSAHPLSEVLMDSNEGCETGANAQFGRYLGDWNIQDWQLQQDGITWTEQQGARWLFTCVGNGIAVQDFWMPNAGGYGTNLRIHDPDTNKWDIAWTATGAPGFAHITAQEDKIGDIVMHYVSPAQTPPRRITFSPPTKDGWDWTMEFSFDGEQSWTPVYKMKATPRN